MIHIKHLAQTEFRMSVTDTLPPFPMYVALPRSEYYGGSAPPAPSAGVAPIPAPSHWQ
jgi:hypothetical protein